MSLGELRQRGDAVLDRGLRSATERLTNVPQPVFDAFIMLAGAALLIYLFVEGSPYYAVAAVVVLFAGLLLMRRPATLAYVLFALIPVYWLNLLGESLRVITVLTLIGFAYHASRLVLARERPAWNRIYLGYGLFLVTCAYSLFNSGDIVGQSLQALKYFMLSLLFLGVMVGSVRTDRDLRVLLWLLLAWGVFESVLGMLQTFVSPRFFLESTHLSIVEAYSVGGVRRASGTYQVGPRYAMFLMAPLSVIVAGVFSGWVLRRRTWLLLLAPLVMGVFLSLTRIAVVLAFLYVLLFSFFERRRQALIASIAGFLMAGSLAAAVVIAIPDQVKGAFLQRFNDPEEQIYTDRLYFLWNALGAFTEHPVLGIGVGTYESRSFEFMQKYPLPWRQYRWSVADQWNMPESVPVHNEYGRMLAEQGFLSVPIFLFLFFSAFRNLSYVRRRSQQPLIRLWAVAMSMYLAQLMVYLYFHEYFLEEPYISVLPFMISIVLYNYVQRQEAAAPHAAPA